MTAVLPRGPWCAELAQALEALGEGELALGWTQRWLALRPGARIAALVKAPAIRIVPRPS